MKGINRDYNGALTFEEAYLNVSFLQGLYLFLFTAAKSTNVCFALGCLSVNPQCTV